MATAMKDMLANAPRAEAIPALGAPSGRSPRVEIVVPVFNEERDLGRSVRRLLAYLLTPFPFTFRITIADNASTDGTWAIASGLAERLPNVSAVRVSEKGRGRALHQVWSKSHATVLAYMDVDLSTDLAALMPGFRREGDRGVRFDAADGIEAYRALVSAVRMARLVDE